MQRTLSSVPFAALAIVSLALPACAEPACHGGCDDEHAEAGETAATDTTDGGSSAAADYCACMLANCHDTYHSRWGDDHVESEMACLAEAAPVPEAGMDVDAGDFIECRIHYCEAAQSTEMADDADNCPKAVGEAVCM